MLDQLRRQSRSFIIWILFGILIAVFIFAFGPQARGLTSCGSVNGYVAKVGDSVISPRSWRFAMNGLGFASGGSHNARERRAEAIDLLVERSLLGQAAKAAGLKISDQQVEDWVKSGKFYVTGILYNGKRAYFKDGTFDFDALKRFAQSLGLSSVNSFVEEQRRELLAVAMRDLLVASTHASREEVQSRYVQANTKVTVSYVVFQPSVYAQKLRLTDADLKTYLAHHEDAVKKRYQADKRSYANVKPQVHLLHIFIAKKAQKAGGTDTAKGKKANGKKAGKKAAAPKAGAKAAGGGNALARAKRALARIKAGEDFGKVAREMSDDSRTSWRGGDMGWHPDTSLGWGEKVVQAVKKLKVGQLSGIVETKQGYHLFRVEARRKGHLSYDQVKMEIARELATPYYARKAAKRDADAALAQIKAGAKLEDLFAPASSSGAAGASAGAGGTFVPGKWTLKPKAEPVPVPHHLAAPKLESVGPTPRDGDMLAGIGDSKKLANAMFDQLAPGQVAKQVFDVSGNFVIAKLVDRQQADLSKFKDKETQIADSVEFEKGIGLLYSWVQNRCREETEHNGIAVNRQYLSTGNDKKPVTYSPCATLSEDTIFNQLLSQRMRQ